MDAARTAKRNGSNVKIVYRKGLEDMPASKHELNETQIDGVDFEFFKSPIEITDKYISFCETEKIESEDGNYKFVSHYDKVLNMKADSIIIAII